MPSFKRLWGEYCHLACLGDKLQDCLPLYLFMCNKHEASHQCQIRCCVYKCLALLSESCVSYSIFDTDLFFLLILLHILCVL